MLICNVTYGALTTALAETQMFYDVRWREIRAAGHNWRVTLSCERPHGKPGCAVSCRGRHTNSACWHAHGVFFDMLFGTVPEAVVYARGKRITKDGGNWQDYNVGSLVYPLMASEACDCKGDIGGA